MTLGGDTGFLIGVIELNETALHHWQGVLDGRHRLVLSTLTIHELLGHYYKRGQGDTVKQLIAQIRLLDNATFVPVDEVIAERAAGYRHGLGMPAMDSLILATFVEHGCDLVLSTDAHFQTAANQNIASVAILV